MSGRRADVFANVDAFDPDRFLPPREEQREGTHTWLSFGGGRHRCIGENFAYTQIKTIWCPARARAPALLVEAGQGAPRPDPAGYSMDLSLMLNAFFSPAEQAPLLSPTTRVFSLLVTASFLSYEMSLLSPIDDARARQVVSPLQLRHGARRRPPQAQLRGAPRPARLRERERERERERKEDSVRSH